jgi:fatty acid desaturase
MNESPALPRSSHGRDAHATHDADATPIPTPDRVYGAHWYKYDPDKIAPLRKLRWHKPVLASLLNWAWIFLIVRVFLALPHHWFYYPIAAFLIAGRAGVFLQLAHEASHGLIFSNQKLNDWWGSWFGCYPVGLDLEGYKQPHMRHHACVNEHCDPISDTEKYRAENLVRPRLWFLFLKDALGITALFVRLKYAQPQANRAAADPLDDEEYFADLRPVRSATKWDGFRKLASLCLMQGIILAALFRGNVVHYLLLWLLPLMTAHMVLMRVRGIAEHALGYQLGLTDLDHKSWGKFYTRSFGTPARHYGFVPFVWLERILIGSLNIYYHHEHHLFPKIPYYNLKHLHPLLCDQVAQINPYVYAPGYFGSIFFTMNHPAGK